MTVLRGIKPGHYSLKSSFINDIYCVYIHTLEKYFCTCYCSKNTKININTCTNYVRDTCINCTEFGQNTCTEFKDDRVKFQKRVY